MIKAEEQPTNINMSPPPKFSRQSTGTEFKGSALSSRCALVSGSYKEGGMYKYFIFSASSRQMHECSKCQFSLFCLLSFANRMPVNAIDQRRHVTDLAESGMAYSVCPSLRQRLRRASSSSFHFSTLLYQNHQAHDIHKTSLNPPRNSIDPTRAQ